MGTLKYAWQAKVSRGQQVTEIGGGGGLWRGDEGDSLYYHGHMNTSEEIWKAIKTPAFMGVIIPLLCLGVQPQLQWPSPD